MHEIAGLGIGSFIAVAHGLSSLLILVLRVCLDDGERRFNLQNQPKSLTDLPHSTCFQACNLTTAMLLLERL